MGAGATPFQKKRGNVLMAAIVFAVALGVGVMVLQNYIPVLRGQGHKSAENLEHYLAVKSALDFFKFAVKKQWCFKADMPLNDDTCKTLTPREYLEHPRNMDRLLVSDMGVQYIASRGSAPSIDKVRAPIELTYSLDTLTPDHPLRVVADNLRRVADPKERSKKIKLVVNIERILHKHLPSAGSEAYIQINIRLTFGKKVDLEGETVVGMYPREIATFALVVARDFNMNDEGGRGDFAVPPIPFDTYKPGTGLNFDSPVFVNRHLRLFEVKEDDTRVSPVVFAEPVVLGAGKVMIGSTDKAFKQKSAGGVGDRLNADMKGFGGLLAGVEVDSEKDRGLDYLFGLETAAPVDTDLIARCQSFNNRKFDLGQSRETEIVVKKATPTRSGGNAVFSSEIALTAMNSFVEQKNFLGARVGTPSTPSGYLKAGTLSKSDAKPVMGVIVERAGPDGGTVQESVAAQMSGDEEWNIPLSAPSPKNVVVGRKSCLEAEKALRLAPEDAAKKSSRDTACSSYARMKADAMTSVELDARLASLTDMASKNDSDLAPSLVVRTTPVVGGGKDATKAYPNRVTLAVEVKNEMALADDVAWGVNVTPYDAGSDRKGGWMRTQYVPAGGADQPEVRETRLRGNLMFLEAGLRLEWSAGGYRDIDATSSTTWTNMNASRRNSTYPIAAKDLPDAYDLAALEESCGLSSETGTALAAWDKDFAPFAAHSWHIRDPNSPDGRYVPGGVLQIGDSAGPGGFQIYSRVDNCVIPASTQFVAGLFTCNSLTIQGRSTPLRIIGTIVAGRAQVDPSALRAGIHWSTIYHPSAGLELRARNVLGKGAGDCDFSGVELPPIWHPAPNLEEMARLFRCNPVSLRYKAEPFRWTTIDPDCATDTANGTTRTCKFQVRRYRQKEFSREVDL